MKYFIISLTVIALLFLIIWVAKFISGKIRFNRQLELDYPKSKYKGNARKRVKRILTKFNAAFYRYYPNVKDDFNIIFETYPKKHSHSFELKKQIQLYETMNLEVKALEALKKVLPIKLTIENQIDYFEKELLKARQARVLIDGEMYKSFFPKLYRNRRGILMAIENNCIKIIEKLNAEKETFEKAIQDLSKMKKKGFLMKLGTFTWNLATAPIRHVSNIVGGIVDNDPGRVGKSATMLLLGAVGIGLAFEAIDGLEGLDASGNLALDESYIPSDGGQHFVEPHTRILADGTGIWVDGDGDTSVNLSAEEGGGYFRSNP